MFGSGMSVLEGKPDIFEDWREKFLNTYKVRGGETSGLVIVNHRGPSREQGDPGGSPRNV